MDVQLLKTLGGVAGLAGVAVGMILLLYRDIIRKSIFPTLSQTNAYRLLRTVAILAWSIAMTGIACWAWSVSLSHKSDAAAAPSDGVADSLVVAGTVVDRVSNSGIGAVTISVGSTTTLSEDNGNFQVDLADHQVGRIRLTATKAGYDEINQSVVPPVHDIVLQMSRSQ